MHTTEKEMVRALNKCTDEMDLLEAIQKDVRDSSSDAEAFDARYEACIKSFEEANGPVIPDYAYLCSLAQAVRYFLYREQVRS